MDEPTLRLAEASDAPVMADFNVALARESEHFELDRDRVLRGVAALFQDPSRGFYLLAEIGEGVIGQVMVTFEWSDWRNGVFWWIQSVYVRPEFRGRGVFSKLFRELVKRARRSPGVCGLRLYVERENRPAKEIYQRLGMLKTGYQVYELDFVLSRASVNQDEEQQNGSGAGGAGTLEK